MAHVNNSIAKAFRTEPLASPEQPQRTKEKKPIKILLKEAEELLRQVDDSFLAQKEIRDYPTFQAVEVRVGKLLGVGGFCSVFEVEEFDIEEMAPSAAVSSPPKTGISFADDAKPAQPHANEHDAARAEDESHYDVASARQHMKTIVKRNGDARYAIKRLHHELSDIEQARGMVDLALECKYLCSLCHPNIVKMRAMAAGPLIDPHFFIILDRLYLTLDKKIKEWAKLSRSYAGSIFGWGAKKVEQERLLEERLLVAYDLSSAFRYMHEHRLVYRDTKQENIGFDVRGDVKLFDFGLSKCMSQALKAHDSIGREVYGYELTPRTGSIPYMAPEVAKCKRYDEKCDVFSFAILLWEILAMKRAFYHYSRKEFYDQVVRFEERPWIQRQWPPLTRLLMRDAWDDNPQKRPDMKSVSAMIRGDLNEMSSETRVCDRTRYLRERSMHSFLEMDRSSSVSTRHLAENGADPKASF